MTDAFAPLVGDLRDLFARGVDAPLDDGAFQAYALRVFGWQYRACPTYRAFCAARGVTPDTVVRWEDIPPVPATAFKHLDLVSGDPDAAEAIYRTSGTSRGAGARGRHFVPDLSLYHASLRPNFRAHLLPEGGALEILSLIPSPRDVPDSSLSAMVGDVAASLAPSVRWLADPASGTDAGAFAEAAGEVMEEGEPVLVVGTAFAFVHLLDALAAAGTPLPLPEGSRIMETGGFKGRSRAVSREELYGAMARWLDVPPGRVVNEYGMTELLSQLYEPVLVEGEEGRGRHVPPPWLRVRALDPVTLAPLPEGRPGLLVFFDLANAGSVSHVLTEDMGRVTPEGVVLQGRVRGAEPRGCSLAMEELLAATRGDP